MFMIDIILRQETITMLDERTLTIRKLDQDSCVPSRRHFKFNIMPLKVCDSTNLTLKMTFEKIHTIYIILN